MKSMLSFIVNLALVKFRKFLKTITLSILDSHREWMTYIENYTILSPEDLQIIVSQKLNKIYFFFLTISIWAEIIEYYKYINDTLKTILLVISVYYLNIGISIYNFHVVFGSRVFIEVLLGVFFLNLANDSFNISIVNLYTIYFLWIHLKNCCAFCFSFIIILIQFDKCEDALQIVGLIFHNIVCPILLYKFLQFVLLLNKQLVENLKHNFNLLNRRQQIIFASMTHDLRNPICSQINVLDDLKSSQNISNNQKGSIEIAIFSAELQLNLINNILDFSKIESGKFEINYVPTNINQLINKVLKIETELALKKGIYLKIIINSSPFEDVLADPNRISQIIMNLVGNSIKFTSKGGIVFVVNWVSSINQINELLYKGNKEQNICSDLKDYYNDQFLFQKEGKFKKEQTLKNINTQDNYNKLMRRI